MLDRRPPTSVQRGSALLLHATQARGASLCEHIGIITMCYVDTVIGNRVYLRAEAANLCCRHDRLQAVVALGTTAVANADTIRCLPWNGLHGGIIAVMDSVVDLRGVVVDAAAKGFRGGYQTFPRCDTADDGQSDDVLASGESYNIGVGSGAGTHGPARNAGGSGGSSIALGGRGGSTSSMFNPVRPGTQSNAIIANGLLSLGAGGGAGQRNDISCSAGGRGGGLIVIIADTILTDEHTRISAAGGDGCTALADGAGGGGAGGVIALVTSSMLDRCILNLRGGNGGNVVCSGITSGPGGGGAGGILVMSQMPNSIEPVLEGGTAGLRTCDTTNDVHGATDGSSGTIDVRSAIVRWLPDRTRMPVRLSASDTVLEYGASAQLSVQGDAIVTWIRGAIAAITPDGKHATTEPITEPMWFVIEARTPSGCIVHDSIRLRPRVEANTLNVEADYIRAKPGDTVDLFLRCTLSAPYERALQGRVLISTHAPVAVPVRSARVVEQRAFIEVPFMLMAGAISTFRREPLAIVLGDSLTTQISIDSVHVTGAALNVRRRHGRLTLDSICLAGGRPRLFDPTASLLRIEGRSIHARADELYLTDLLGRGIGAVITAYAETVSAQIPVDVHGLILIVLVQAGRPIHRTIWIE